MLPACRKHDEEMKKLILFSFLAGLTLPAFAQEPTEVLFFGGYGSTESQMNCWKKGAEGKSGGGYRFRGFGYPVGSGAGKASAVSGGSATLRKLAAEINAHPGKRYVIAGHSSGAALSNRLAELVDDPKRIDLVNLDGFAPSAQLQKKVGSSVCWYAKGANGLMSRNAGSMKSNCKVSKAVRNNNCTSAWCLHFGVINNKVPGNLSGATFRSQGYRGCDSNTDWLPAKDSASAEDQTAAPAKNEEPAPVAKQEPAAAPEPTAVAAEPPAPAPVAQPKKVKRVTRTYSSTRSPKPTTRRRATQDSTQDLFRHPLGDR